jgi:hypothetical protein
MMARHSTIRATGVVSIFGTAGPALAGTERLGHGGIQPDRQRATALESLL